MFVLAKYLELHSCLAGDDAAEMRRHMSHITWYPTAMMCLAMEKIRKIMKWKTLAYQCPSLADYLNIATDTDTTVCGYICITYFSCFHSYITDQELSVNMGHWYYGERRQPTSILWHKSPPPIMVVDSADDGSDICWNDPTTNMVRMNVQTS